MDAKEHQATVDVAKVVVNEYFDHYLTEVFPSQLDRMFQSHNQDAEAHEVRFKVLVKAKRKMDRILWMILGGAAVVSVLGTLLIEHLSAVIKALAG
jgi:hypothetical protein